MNNQWKSFLESHAAQISAEGEVRFTTEDRFPACALFDLSHLGLIRVAGEDAASFLQGQFTNDIREVSDRHSQLSAYCSPKGRMMATFRILKNQDDYLLQVPRETHPTVLKRLPMFILMSKARVSDASDQLVTIGLAGACAEKLLRTQFDVIPEQTDDTLQQGAVTLIRLPGELPRFQLTGQPETLIGIWENLAEEASPANREYWSLLDIRAGIPTIYQATAEAFVPQMTNLQLLNGVSFTKGCYTGQEVVARMKYLGKLKRRMYYAAVQTDIPPRPGDELFSSGTASGQGAGRVVDAQPSPEGGFELLAVSEIQSFENGGLHLLSDTGPRLEPRQLPYGFEEA